MSEERGTERDPSEEAPSTPHREKSTEEGDSQEHKQKEDITSSKVWANLNLFTTEKAKPEQRINCRYG